MADTPGMIPIGPERQSAEGLIYKGGPITSDSANNLRDLGFDLSILDPKNSDIASIPSKKQQMAPIDVRPEGEVFEYRNESKGRVGYYRVTVSKTDQNGVSRLYKIVVSKKGHNYLMRKALLRKLGYQTPDVKYLKSFKIKFDGAFSRNSFVEALNWATVDSTERWVLDGIKTEGDTVTMQDAVIMDADEQKYALPDGEMDASRIENRRILHSLVVPFNLVDNPESVNVFSWDACRITNGNVYLPFESPSVVSEYRTSFEDARWAVRRIAKLSRQELAEIVAEANLPKAVAVLMTEKVVSRRNTLMDCFKVEGEKYEFNAQISMKPDLVNGKLLTKDFAGYGPRFAFDDPTAPLTGPEMKAFFKSRVFSTAIDNAVKKFDKVSGLSTNLNKELTELQVKKAQERFEHFLKTGEIKKTPFNMFVIPTFAAKLILSRDVVTGSYLGTDHMVQQADTFGYALDAGLFMGTEGLPSPKMIVGGVAKLGTVRTYTHIKPITSIQAALKEPFKNVMVPLLKRDY
ncbi:MAG: hypothetical protein V4692_03430, partial [Bdellovibrionota bacterium]